MRRSQKADTFTGDLLRHWQHHNRISKETMRGKMAADLRVLSPLFTISCTCSELRKQWVGEMTGKSAATSVSNISHWDRAGGSCWYRLGLGGSGGSPSTRFQIENRNCVRSTLLKNRVLASVGTFK